MDIEDTTTQNHLLPDQIKWEIIFCYQQGTSNRQIAQTLGQKHNRPSLCHKTVKLVIDKFEQTGGVNNAWSDKGRPPVVDEEMEDELINHCVENRFQSVKEYKEGSWTFMHSTDH